MTPPAHPRSANSAPSNRGSSVAVVGAGPGGLAAAMILAAAGFQVTIYEAQPDIGGRTGQLRLPDPRNPHADPFRFDRGPTFFLMPYVLEEIFALTGRRLTDYADLRRLDPMYRLIVGQPNASPVVLDATQDVAEMMRRIAAVEPRDAVAFENFLTENRRKLDLMTPILRAPIRSVFDLATVSSLKVAPLLKPHLSVNAYLSNRFRHPAVRLALSFQSKYLGMSPYDCPSLFSILPFIEYEYGVWHPIGGCHQVMRAMAQVCTDLGATIRTDSPVDAIHFQGDRATAVSVRGQLHHHDRVVVNADAAWALKKLLPDSARARVPSWRTPQSIDARNYSCSTFMLYLGVRGRVDLPHHTIYVSERYRDNLDEISNLGTLSDDPSIYLCNPTPIDPSLAPPGDSSLYVLLPTPNLKTSDGKINWSGADAQRAREACFDQIERRLGIPDIRSRVLCEQAFSPLDWAAQNINFGATFNLAHNLGQMLHKRVQHRLPGLNNLYFVGGGTHPGSGLPVIWLSSQTAARLVCDDAGIPFPTSSAPSSPTPSFPAATVRDRSLATLGS